MKIFFTSDLHFHHTNILKFSPAFRQRFKNVEDMNEQLITYWNSVVSKDDVVYNLGDFSFSKKLNEIKNTLNKLNGKHHLILGNHDQLIEQHKEELLNSFKQDGNKLLESVENYQKVSIEENKFVLFHYPILEWDQCHRGALHLYGHIHNRVANLKGRALNVGIDLHYKLLSLEDVKNLLNKIDSIEHHYVKESTHYYGNDKICDTETKSALIKFFIANLNK